MVKGQARILLHGKREFLVEALKEFRALYEITAALEVAGVGVSISSLYRYMVSDLSEEYAEYLRCTGRGLISSRCAKVKSESAQKSKPSIYAVARPGQITNAGGVSKFLKDKR